MNVFINPFEAPQRSVKIKIQLNFLLNDRYPNSDITRTIFGKRFTFWQNAFFQFRKNFVISISPESSDNQFQTFNFIISTQLSLPHHTHQTFFLNEQPKNSYFARTEHGNTRHLCTFSIQEEFCKRMNLKTEVTRKQSMPNVPQEMFVFRKTWRTLLFCNTHCKICPFALLPTITNSRLSI